MWEKGYFTVNSWKKMFRNVLHEYRGVGQKCVLCEIVMKQIKKKRWNGYEWTISSSVQRQSTTSDKIKDKSGNG
jgi:hypothetical protein